MLKQKSDEERAERLAELHAKREQGLIKEKSDAELRKCEAEAKLLKNKTDTEDKQIKDEEKSQQRILKEKNYAEDKPIK